MWHRTFYDCSIDYIVPNVALMAVKTCSKAILLLMVRHGKSPCFSQVTFLQLVGPDYPLSILPCVDGQEFLECAF
jgi:hypothetical protein